MLIVAGRQAKQEKKCESMLILELTEASKQPDLTQTALLQDVKDTPSRSCSSSGQDDKGGSSTAVSVEMPL